MKLPVLTPEHEQKLTGMSYVLFPEYILEIVSQKKICLYKGKHFNNIEDAQFFHCFEFCMVVLPQKLFGKNYDRSPGWHAIIEQCKAGQCIVDALYQQFTESCAREGK